jgi:hypothetical protein
MHTNSGTTQIKRGKPKRIALLLLLLRGDVSFFFSQQQCSREEREAYMQCFASTLTHSSSMALRSQVALQSHLHRDREKAQQQNLTVHFVFKVSCKFKKF